MVGLLVTPVTESSRTRRSSSPVASISRESESIQTLWPSSASCCSLLFAIASSLTLVFFNSLLLLCELARCAALHLLDFFQSLRVTGVTLVEARGQEGAHQL